MQTRHRTPSIFNLSMVDVLCCALGCVILLWLLNLREARQRAAAVGETSQELATTRSLRSETAVRLRTAEQSTGSTRAALAQTKEERDRAANELTAARARATELDRSLAANKDLLARKTREQRKLSSDLAASRQRVAALDALVREKETRLETSTRGAEEQEERLRDLDARLRRAQPEVALGPEL